MTMLHRRAAGLALAAIAAGIATQASAQSADEAAIARQVDALSQAMLQVDGAQLRALTAEGLSYGHSAGRIENKAQFIANLESRANPFGSIRLSGQTISVVGDNAIVRHTFDGETTGGGRTTPVHIGVLQIWHKEGGTWKLLARQAFRL